MLIFTDVSPNLHPAKRALISDKHFAAATTEKLITADNIPNNTVVNLFVGPRRRLDMGTDENGAATLMFRATDAVKYAFIQSSFLFYPPQDSSKCAFVVCVHISKPTWTRLSIAYSCT